MATDTARLDNVGTRGERMNNRYSLNEHGTPCRLPVAGQDEPVPETGSQRVTRERRLFALRYYALSSIGPVFTGRALQAILSLPSNLYGNWFRPARLVCFCSSSKLSFPRRRLKWRHKLTRSSRRAVAVRRRLFANYAFSLD